MSRASVGTGGNSLAILSNMKSNSSLNPFFDALNDAKRVVQSRKAEEGGTASYVVTPAHAAFHRRIVEDRIDNMAHIYSKVRLNKNPRVVKSRFNLCPVTVHLGNSMMRFIWSSEQSLDDGTLRTYIESILCNSQPPLSGDERQALARRLISTDVSAQVSWFKRVSDKYAEIVDQFPYPMDGIKLIHQQTPHIVHTRKSNATQTLPQGFDPSSSSIAIEIAENWKIDWDVFTPDVLTLDYVREIESNQDMISASDMLFTILDSSFRHRAALLHVSFPTQKKHSSVKPHVNDESSQYDEGRIREMDADLEGFKDEIICALQDIIRFEGEYRR
jgi:hypothetical protein